MYSFTVLFLLVTTVLIVGTAIQANSERSVTTGNNIHVEQIATTNVDQFQYQDGEGTPFQNQLKPSNFFITPLPHVEPNLTLYDYNELSALAELTKHVTKTSMYHRMKYPCPSNDQNTVALTSNEHKNLLYRSMDQITMNIQIKAGYDKMQDPAEIDRMHNNQLQYRQAQLTRVNDRLCDSLYLTSDLTRPNRLTKVLNTILKQNDMNSNEFCYDLSQADETSKKNLKYSLNDDTIHYNIDMNRINDTNNERKNGTTIFLQRKDAEKLVLYLSKHVEGEGDMMFVKFGLLESNIKLFFNTVQAQIRTNMHVVPLHRPHEDHNRSLANGWLTEKHHHLSNDIERRRNELGCVILFFVVLTVYVSIFVFPSSLKSTHRQSHIVTATSTHTLTHWGKFIGEHARKMITLGLAVQVTIVQASEVNIARKAFMSEGSVKDKFSFLPTLELNQKTLPIINKTALTPKALSTVTLTWSSTLANEIEEVERNVAGIKDKNYANSPSSYHVDINEVLRQFDKVNANLQELALVFSSNKNNISSKQRSNRNVLRIARSPLGRRPECSVSKDKLTELKQVIETTMSVTNTIQSSNNCELDFRNSESCNELTSLVQCGVGHLMNGFTDAKKNKVSIEEITKWKNAYNDLWTSFQRVFDDVRKSVSDEYKTKMDKFLTNLQELGKLIEDLRKDLEESTIDLCISEIHSGAITNAIKKFKKLKSNSELSTIIKKSYNYLRDVDTDSNNKLNNVDHIMDFIRSLPSYTQDVIAYQSLFNEMERNDHLHSPKVLMFEYSVKNSMTSGDIFLSTDEKMTLRSLKTKLSTPVAKIIDGWVNLVLNGNYEGIKEYAKKYSNSFRPHQGQLIEKAYAKNSAKTETIIKFIRDLPDISNGIVGYSSLFEKMKYNNHLDSYELIMLAYRVKEYMEMPIYPNVPKDDQNTFTTLKYKLPDSVRRLIWNGDSCTIKSTYWNEYLYAASIENADFNEFFYSNYDRDRRNVFTWVPGDLVKTANWKFETTDNASSFTIKNTYLSEYLYAADYKFDRDRRRVFTWIPGGRVNSGDWKIKLQNNAAYFTIYNIYQNEYLYAAEYKQIRDRHRIFTWIPGGTVKNGYWKIDC